MPVTIRANRDAEPIPLDDGAVEVSSGIVPNKKVRMDPDQFEAFGRLRMTTGQMAAYYGLSNSMLVVYTQRPHLRAAYERGRAEIVMAVRQKQLKMALDGNVQLLLHAGKHFGEQEGELTTLDREEEKAVHGWNESIRSQAASIRDTILAEKAK